MLCTCLVLFSITNTVWADFDKGLQAYNRKDYTTAFKLFMESANRGDARVQYALGVMYDNGHGVPQNHVEAAKWYRKAAEQGGCQRSE